ncbi:MAG: CDGSH iron-sulfur domain-containing protein [Gemmatimonadota bacterium]
MSEVVIRIIKNGPYRVEGPCRIVDADGNEFDLTGKARISLCRCGGSSTKPFCDATHSKIGFLGAETAVRVADKTKTD